MSNQKPKSKVVSLRVSEKDYNKVKEMCETLGTSVNAFFSDVIRVGLEVGYKWEAEAQKTLQEKEVKEDGEIQ